MSLAAKSPLGFLARFVLVLILLVGAAELFARTVLGLGEPPLSYADPKIEYLWVPSQTCHRLHHLIHINAYSMRSDDFPPHKTEPNELRVMVVGDSVVYDGVRIDQANISTEVLKRALERHYPHRKIVVGNIAAKSWGPPNQLAYIQRFGLFDADWVIFVLNSHDYADVPGFQPVVDVDPDYPGHKPPLALAELLFHYLPRYLPRSFRPHLNPDENPAPTQKDIDWALSSERRMMELAKQSGAKVLLAQMLTIDELGGHPKEGHNLILAVAEQEHVPALEIGPLFEASLRRGQDPYQDPIHPSEVGCRIMGESMAQAIISRSSGVSSVPLPHRNAASIPPQTPDNRSTWPRRGTRARFDIRRSSPVPKPA